MTTDDGTLEGASGLRGSPVSDERATGGVVGPMTAGERDYVWPEPRDLKELQRSINEAAENLARIYERPTSEGQA